MIFQIHTKNYCQQTVRCPNRFNKGRWLTETNVIHDAFVKGGLLYTAETKRVMEQNKAKLEAVETDVFCIARDLQIGQNFI